MNCKCLAALLLFAASLASITAGGCESRRVYKRDR